MTTTVAYCEQADLQIANIPLPSDAQKYVMSTAEEIDSKLGMRYVTPIVVTETPANRPTRLLLKNINSWLGAGRLLLASGAPGEDDQLHQYAIYLVREAQAALASIMDGTVPLPGATPINTDSPPVTGPVISNLDDASGVESFGAVFGNPASTVITRQRSVLPGWPYTW